MSATSHLDPRLLRAFVAVAEELHFTRAAARLYVAQQALSRDIRRLERELGADLFVRSTRRVALSADGERLLPYARRVLAAHDELLAAFGEARPLLVDLNSPGLTTGRRVLHLARELAPEHELMARFESGLTFAAGELLAGRLDASFGRFAGLDPVVRAQLDQQLVRYEPMAVVLPEDHRLAALPEVPLAALAGETVYAGAGNPGPRSGPTSRVSCSRAEASKSRHRRRSRWATRSSNGSWPRCGPRSSPWWNSRPCLGRWCDRWSIPFRCPPCRWCGGGGWCTRDFTLCDGPRPDSRRRRGGCGGLSAGGFRPVTPTSFRFTSNTWQTRDLHVRYIRGPDAV